MWLYSEVGYIFFLLLVEGGENGCFALAEGGRERSSSVCFCFKDWRLDNEVTSRTTDSSMHNISHKQHKFQPKFKFKVPLYLNLLTMNYKILQNNDIIVEIYVLNIIGALLENGVVLR